MAPVPSDLPDDTTACDPAALDRVRRVLAEFGTSEAPEPPPAVTARMVAALHRVPRSG